MSNQGGSHIRMEPDGNKPSCSTPPPNTQIQPSCQVASCSPTEPEGKQHSGSTEYQLKKYLLLLATLVATVTYAAGLNLPGGVWQENTQDGHIAGDVILRSTHYHRYLIFYYCNATAFAASLVVCLLLLVLNSKSTYLATALRVVMFLDLLGLMGAYVAGSCQDAFTTIYSSVIMSAIFAYIVIAFLIYVCSKFPNNEGNVEMQGEDLDNHKREDQHEVLMLLATFAVTITYVAGLNPPGGFWGNPQDSHRVSNPILKDNNSSRYQAFFVCNTTAFVASLLIVMLLLDKNLRLNTWFHSNKLNRPSLRYYALYGFIAIALFGLVGAYAAGSCREFDTTAYVISLIVAVLAYIFLQVTITNAITQGAPKRLRHIRELFVGDEKSREGNINQVSNNAKEEKTSGASEKATVDEAPGKSKEPEKAKANEALENARNLVMLLATLVTSITYQAGLDPPGGLWPDDQEGHHKGGDPILLTTHPARYKVFFYSNSAAFVASLVVIIMVQNKSLLKRHTLEAAMLLDLFGLIGAYAAGSSRDVSTSIYVVALAGAVLIYVVIHIVFFTLDHKDNHKDAHVLDNRREVLLLLAILVATLTYQAGLTPPGGFWLDDTPEHHAGFPVLLYNYPPRYKSFFYCNAMSFMASIALIVLLVNPNLYRPGIRCYALYVCMVAGMFGLMGAYAAGSSRELRTSIYVLTLVAAVFAFVVLQVVVFFCFPNYIKKETCGNTRNGSSRVGNSDTPSGTVNGPSGQGEGCGEPSGRVNHDPDIESSRAEGKDLSPKEKMNKELRKKEKDLREYLMLLGVLAASVTYQTGLKPPGGLWQDNSNGHIAGNSILRDMNKSRYRAFFYSNSTSFMASIVVVVLLLPRTLHNHNLLLWPMHTAIVLNMLGLLGAYAAGSTTDWETSRNVICLTIPVLLYIIAYAAWPFLYEKVKATQKAKAMKINQQHNEHCRHLVSTSDAER